jgi:hypothetical protein
MPVITPPTHAQDSMGEELHAKGRRNKYVRSELK